MTTKPDLYLVAIIDNDMTPAYFNFITKQQHDHVDNNTSDMEEYSDELLNAIDDNNKGRNQLILKDKNGNTITESDKDNIAEAIIKLHEAGYTIVGTASAFIV